MADVKAPEWANWIATDENGEVWWFENEPERSDVEWDCVTLPWSEAEWAPYSEKYPGDWEDSKRRIGRVKPAEDEIFADFDYDAFKARMHGGLAAPSSGRKYDRGKNRWDLLPFREIGQVVSALTKGAEKYEDNNWQRVDDPKSRYFAALMRHLVAWETGEQMDEDMAENHLALVVCNALFLLYFDNETSKSLVEDPPVVEKSYSRRQRDWLRGHDLVIGDCVRVMDRPMSAHSGGWENSWISEMDNSIGECMEITDVKPPGIELDGGYRYPYFVLEAIKNDNA